MIANNHPLPLRPRGDGSGSAGSVVAIVDDDADLLNALRFSLEVDGYTVRTYRTVEEALASGSDASRTECLIADYLLPRMNGLDLLEALRLRGFRGPAILTTSYAKPAVRERATRLGVRILEKPLLGEALAEAVRQALGSG